MVRVVCRFVLPVQGELFSDVKERIQKRIGISQKDFEKAKFIIVQCGLSEV